MRAFKELAEDIEERTGMDFEDSMEFVIDTGIEDTKEFIAFMDYCKEN